MKAKKSPALSPVTALDRGNGEALRAALQRSRNPKSAIAALAKRALNDRVNPKIGAALVGAYDLILSQPFDEGIKDLLPAMAIGAVHQRHVAERDVTEMIAKLMPLVAKSYFEAELIGAWAGGLAQDDHEFAESLDLYEIAIACPKMRETANYVMALWVIQESNTKIPLDRERARRFLRACLPHGKQNPAIFHNAACVYAELGDVDGVVAQIRSLKAQRYDALDAVRKDCLQLHPALAKHTPFKRAFAE